jgi:lipopolysaccharide/colanic/teichoic acid biosynthesis glycosyltransferase
MVLSTAFTATLGDARRRDELLRAATKRAIDILVASTLLLVLLPFLVVIAVAIAYDGFPILFRQQRIGEHGRAFTLVKFRSMRADADPAVHQRYVASLLRDQGSLSAVYKVANDPRITPVGALLRRTSLDELPQLWNVLRGDMSLVGPRPDVPYAVSEYAEWMRQRLEAKPGITGLWQVSGRSRLSLQDMYRLDLAYVSSASLRLDIEILLRTIPAVLKRDGAA